MQLLGQLYCTFPHASDLADFLNTAPRISSLHYIYPWHDLNPTQSYQCLYTAKMEVKTPEGYEYGLLTIWQRLLTEVGRARRLQ